MAQAARCAWEVHAGIIPGQPEEKWTKQWFLTSEEWNSEEGLRKLLYGWHSAVAYATELQLRSAQGYDVNWVKIEWVWF